MYAPCWLAGSVFSCLGLICRGSWLHRTSSGDERRGRREGERDGERERRKGERGRETGREGKDPEVTC